VGPEKLLIRDKQAIELLELVLPLSSTYNMYYKDPLSTGYDAIIRETSAPGELSRSIKEWLPFISVRLALSCGASAFLFSISHLPLKAAATESL